jgi:membrane-bound lytic murein transglycosylase C
VLASAAKYQVSPTLIYAIIETESSFNPFAVSTANAYGLMQIIPSTAGKDVYTRIKKRSDQPTREALFKPEYNIDIGTAYLHILDDIYLKKITDVQSREYSTISAYNGGAGNVFKTFSSNRDRAPSVINSLTAKQVYKKLTEDHPRSETRRYLQKVLKFRENY